MPFGLDLGPLRLDAALPVSPSRRWLKTTTNEAAVCHSGTSGPVSASLFLASSCQRAICSRVGRGRRFAIAR